MIHRNGIILLHARLSHVYVVIACVYKYLAA